MQKARGQAFPRRSRDIALPLLVSARFQVLFHSPPGVLFTFPSRYWFTIGHRGVFSLRRWAPQIPTGFHVPRSTWERNPRSLIPFAYGAIILYGGPFHVLQLEIRFVTSWHIRTCARSRPTTPPVQRVRTLPYGSVWAFSRSLATTGKIESIFLFLGILRCFSSPG